MSTAPDPATTGERIELSALTTANWAAKAANLLRDDEIILGDWTKSPLTATMSQLVGSPEKVLLAWLAAGILSLVGALTYAELGAMMPRSGGFYVFARRAAAELALLQLVGAHTDLHSEQGAQRADRGGAQQCDADARPARDPLAAHRPRSRPLGRALPRGALAIAGRNRRCLI